MPFKSDAQRRYFNANRDELEAQGVDVDEWNDASRGKKLPERAKKRKKKAAARAMANPNWPHLKQAIWEGWTKKEREKIEQHEKDELARVTAFEQANPSGYDAEGYDLNLQDDEGRTREFNDPYKELSAHPSWAKDTARISYLPDTGGYEGDRLEREVMEAYLAERARGTDPARLAALVKLMGTEDMNPDGIDWWNMSDEDIGRYHEAMQWAGGDEDYYWNNPANFPEGSDDYARAVASGDPRNPVEKKAVVRAMHNPNWPHLKQAQLPQPGVQPQQPAQPQPQQQAQGQEQQQPPQPPPLGHIAAQVAHSAQQKQHVPQAAQQYVAAQGQQQGKTANLSSSEPISLEKMALQTVIARAMAPLHTLTTTLSSKRAADVTTPPEMAPESAVAMQQNAGAQAGMQNLQPPQPNPIMTQNIGPTPQLQAGRPLPGPVPGIGTAPWSQTLAPGIPKMASFPGYVPMRPPPRRSTPSTTTARPTTRRPTTRRPTTRRPAIRKSPSTTPRILGEPGEGIPGQTTPRYLPSTTTTTPSAPTPTPTPTPTPMPTPTTPSFTGYRNRAGTGAPATRRPTPPAASLAPSYASVPSPARRPRRRKPSIVNRPGAAQPKPLGGGWGTATAAPRR